MIAALLAHWKPLALGLGLALALLFARDITRMFAEGQRAIGAAEAVNEETSHADAVNKVRACVRACRADGGVWDGAQGTCRRVANVPAACR